MAEENVAAAALIGMNNSSQKERPAVIGALQSEIQASGESFPDAQDASSKASATGRNRKPKRGKKEEPKFLVEPRVIQVVKKPRSFMNHSYRDFSSVPKELDYEVATKIEDMTFPQKVHHILSQDEYKKWIGWMPHGRAFRVHLPAWFEQKISEKYFGHKRYSSFLRQLSNHGFKHISKGTDRNCYYHEVSSRRLFDTCSRITQIFLTPL